MELSQRKKIAASTDTHRLSEYNSLAEQLRHADYVLIGLGAEWARKTRPNIRTAYEALARMLEGTDYFIVTTNTDAAIFDSPLEPTRITAPCGNETWRQCSRSCTKDIWEPHEIPDDICPHCGAPLTGNTIAAASYIEEGYLPQWQKYTYWLTRTVNKKLLLLELGEGFHAPTVIRWPFEKMTMVNQKAYFYRVNEKFSQLAQGLRERACPAAENSVDWVCNIEKGAIE